MSFKEYFFKKMIPNYFMIVTFITIGMAVSGMVFYGNINISMVTLFVPPLFGVIGCLPMLLDFAFLRVKSSGLGLLLYNAVELVLLEAVILTAAYFIGMIDSALTAAITAGMVFAIFTAVGAIMYLQDKKFCDDLNDALAEYSQKTGN
jgi:hypothetical protein